MSTRPIDIGSRNIRYKTRWGSGVGTVTDIQTTRTGDWLCIRDSKTGHETKVRRGQTQRAKN
jgi:ribosomal 30S subunit maturation factor RimM